MSARAEIDAVPAAGRATPPAGPTVHLHAGEVMTSAHPRLVTTILGSCVAACLWDPVARVGGLNHFLLPLHAGGDRATPRFGNVAMRDLLDGVLALGAGARRLQGKLFGGACVIESFRGNGRHLGQKNVELALAFLDAERIPVIETDTGGTRGRKLIFDLGDGAAWVKLL